MDSRLGPRSLVWADLQVFTLLRNIFHSLFPMRFMSLVVMDVPPGGPRRGYGGGRKPLDPLQRWGGNNLAKLVSWLPRGRVIVTVTESPTSPTASCSVPSFLFQSVPS